MRKILLIEDVVSRQEDFMEEQDFKLEDYTNVLDNAIGANYKEIENSIKDDNFDFSEYAVIMVHGSAFGKNNVCSLDTLKQYCKENKTPLIEFSGGNSSHYSNTGFEYLTLNSKDFYSHNLKVFLDAYKQNKYNVLMLIYGEKWILNNLLNVLEKTNIYLKDNSDENIVYLAYKNFTEADTLANVIEGSFAIKTDNGWVHREVLESLRDSIVKHIEKISNV